MADVVIKQANVPDNLRKQLAVTVRSIQWSYAIFWSLSVTQAGYNINSLAFLPTDHHLCSKFLGLNNEKILT